MRIRIRDECVAPASRTGRCFGRPIRCWSWRIAISGRRRPFSSRDSGCPRSRDNRTLHGSLTLVLSVGAQHVLFLGDLVHSLSG